MLPVKYDSYLIYELSSFTFCLFLRLNDLLGEGSDQNGVTSETRMPFNKELDKFIGELPSINKYLNMFNRKGDRKKKRKKGKGKRNRKRKNGKRKRNKENQHRKNGSETNDENKNAGHKPPSSKPR